VLGGIAALHDYNWTEAGEQFKHAMASESLPPSVRTSYALNYLVPLGRFEEAIREQAKAIAHDPLNSNGPEAQAFVLVCAEMYEPAIVEARKSLEFDDRNERLRNRTAHLVIAMSYFFQGKLGNARESAEEAMRTAPWNPLAVGLLAGLLTQAGEKERAQKLIATVHETMPTGMVMYHLVCFEIDAAIDRYERDIELHLLGSTMLASAGFFKPLRVSPRWPKLAKMMNLPETA
jgi:tetratricopeptide (TPR) repeat protein